MAATIHTWGYNDTCNIRVKSKSRSMQLSDLLPSSNSALSLVVYSNWSSIYLDGNTVLEKSLYISVSYQLLLSRTPDQEEEHVGIPIQMI